MLEGILQAKGRFDGSIGIRCSCRAAICGSCGVRINGQPGLACHTHLDKAKRTSKDGVIEIEPMGNMPVIKDLIVDMDAVHWKKIQRVTPWLINKEPIPEREYIVDRESMVDVTQTMACIQCGACVSDCLSMEVDPLFIGPAALAKSYRFVGDPRDAEQFERLKDLAEDPHGIYDCTHCFKCIEACPKGVAPMNQIMRLRRRAGNDHHINDRNNGERHERAFVNADPATTACCTRPSCCRAPTAATRGSASSTRPPARSCSTRCRSITKALLRRKVTPMKARFRPTRSPRPTSSRSRRSTKRSRAATERIEFNLYISGTDEDNAENRAASASKPPATPTRRTTPDEHYHNEFGQA